MIFQKKDTIDGYTVLFPLKKSFYAETYRVRNEEGKNRFMKIICLSKLQSNKMDDGGNVVEIEVLKKVNHKNICKYVADGSFVHKGQKHIYIITEFVSGETLSERLIRENQLSVYETKLIAINVLNALNYLHNLSSPIIHNEVTIQNVLLDLVGGLDELKLIDFGCARYLDDSNKSLNLEKANLFYLAPECLNGTYCVQSDLFSVGVLVYHLLYGKLPWFTDLSNFLVEKQVGRLSNERCKNLYIPDEYLFEMDEQFLNTIKKALSIDVEDRFQTANDFIKALKSEIKIEDPNIIRKSRSSKDGLKKMRSEVPRGKGFSAIAGMKDLKEQLQAEVIDVLHSPEEYAAYGLTIPNGMLLYGPPGCGKTFFAKHFAEEVGFNFMFVTPSTLQSRYINATQENIAKMFKEAEENSPTIIFIDEMNELVPNRNSDIHEMYRSAVNEMLAQMDRTGEKGVFVIGATNYPNMIDPAILRAGRLDKKYYLGPPNKEARVAMFEMYLSERPYDFGLDYDKLAELTENYVSADIEMIVNDASRIALKIHSKITMTILEDVISKTSPSILLADLRKFERIEMLMKGKPKEKLNEKPKIGFK